MTFVTCGFILPCGTNIATCHNRDLTRDNNKNLQKFLLKIKKKLKFIKIKIKTESDTWHAVNDINYFFSEMDLIEAFFSKVGTQLTLCFLRVPN